MTDVRWESLLVAFVIMSVSEGVAQRATPCGSPSIIYNEGCRSCEAHRKGQEPGRWAELRTGIIHTSEADRTPVHPAFVSA